MASRKSYRFFKLIKIFLVGGVMFFVGVYVLFFTTHNNSDYSGAGKVIIKGDAPKISSLQSAATMSVGRDKCEVPKPECVEMFKIRERMTNYFDPEWEKNSEKITKCVVEGCLEWSDKSVEKTVLETLDLRQRGILGEELTWVANTYISNDQISDVKIWFEDSSIFVTGKANLSLVPGRFLLRAVVKEGDFEVTEVYLGRISLGVDIARQVNSIVHNQLDQYLASFRISYNRSLGLSLNRLEMLLEAPKGLVEVDSNGQLVIDNSVFEKYGLVEPNLLKNIEIQNL